MRSKLSCLAGAAAVAFVGLSTQPVLANKADDTINVAFALEPEAGSVRLTIDAPHGLGVEARWLFDQFLPQAPATSTRACGCAPGACG